MSSRLQLFLSYSRGDAEVVTKLGDALEKCGFSIWRDQARIRGGQPWREAIEEGIRSSRGLIVVLTDESMKSEWVSYEYAFAKGADIPVLAVAVSSRVPGPLSEFQTIPYDDPAKVAKAIKIAVKQSATEIRKAKASAPRLLAKFQEKGGKICKVGGGPALWIDLWIEDAPPQTDSVSIELLDETFDENVWTVKRKAGAVREFLTDDMNSYGDVDILVRGSASRGEGWRISTTLFEALSDAYRNKRLTPAIEKALAQIRNN